MHSYESRLKRPGHLSLPSLGLGTRGITFEEAGQDVGDIDKAFTLLAQSHRLPRALRCLHAAYTHRDAILRISITLYAITYTIQTEKAVSCAKVEDKSSIRAWLSMGAERIFF